MIETAPADARSAPLDGRTNGLLAYVSVVGIVGTLVIVHSLWQAGEALLNFHWLLLAALTVATSAAVLRLSSIPVSFSVAEVFTFTAVLLFGPALGTLTVAIDCTAISLRLAMRQLSWRRFVLSVTAPTLGMWIAAHALFAFVDVDKALKEPLQFAELIVPLSVSAGLYYLLDTWMIAVAIALEERRRVWHVWREHFVQLWVSFLVGAYGAGLIVLGLGGLGPSFLAIVAPLPLLLYYAMRTWVARVNDRIKHHTQFLAIFDSALDALLLLDDERRFADANPAACTLLGISRDRLPASPIDAFLARDSGTDLTARWDTMLAGGAAQGTLVVATGSGERVVEFSFKAGVVPGRHLFIWRDISDRERLEAQLRQSQKMETVGRLAGGLAHDFNNLLTVILGNAGMLRDRHGDEDELVEILGAGERAATMTRQLLAFSRKQVLQTSVVNLNGIVRGVEKLLRRLLDASIELQTVMDPAVWPVKVDPTQIEQVIVNLVVNARDAMPNGGRVILETANVEVRPELHRRAQDLAPGSYVRLTVRDTGTGMDDATRALIFEPFFTTKERDRGTGLGLAMAYGIVRQSGGDVLVDSAPGRGATFSVYLPRVESDVRRAVEPDDSDGTRLHGSETVLLVEDEPAVRSFARHVLQRYGYQVLEASDGEEACHIAADEKHRIAILVTDVVMPNMNGKELAARLRERMASLNVVFMSGYAGESVDLQSHMTNAVFLQKPFTAGALARSVRQLLDHDCSSPQATESGKSLSA